MNTKTADENQRKIFSRPKNKTWQAYKEWVGGMFQTSTGRVPESSHSDEWWIEKSEEFWSNSQGNK